MTGSELIGGGWIASAVIRKVVDLGRSYLGDNYNLHTETRKMLTNVEKQLPYIQSVIVAAEKRQITNTGVDDWLGQLKDAAYEATDVLDKFEGQRIRESLKGNSIISKIVSPPGKMIKNIFFPSKDLMELESAVTKLNEQCKESLINSLCALIHDEKKKEHWGNPDSETESGLAPGVTIFGRDREVMLILDMILNVLYGDFYPQFIDDSNLQQGEDAGSSSFPGRIDKSVLYWGKSGKSIVQKNDVPELSGKGFLNPSESGKSIVQKSDVPKQSRKRKGYFSNSSGYGKSMFSETVKMGDIVKQGDNIVKPISTIAESDSITNGKLAVIPIVGVGGVGKTFVAKNIYNNGRVEEHFALRAWVYVSENYGAKNIMQQMLCCFDQYAIIDQNMSLENTVKKLKKIITERRFLLILDNLSESTKHVWGRLEEVLLHGVVGSVVVVTTQSTSIANTIRTLPEVTLDILQPDSFWDLFRYYAFGDLKDQQPSLLSKQEELIKIGKQIAEKLHGLPLAGKVIGTLLSTRLEREELWEDINRSDLWSIKGASENILPSISVGYNYLDLGLKQCFVYCSIFPKNYVFDWERLVQMWIAHEFIQPDTGDTVRLGKGEIRLEDIGRKWFDELVERSFFQPTIIDGKYLMHDLIRELAIAVSIKEMRFLKSHDNYLPPSARHVGIDCDNSEVEWKCKDSTKLRTVILFGNWTKCTKKSISNSFAKCNGLRVLDLSYILLETNEPINAACHLLHLRFVDLSFTGIKSIPVEFCNLCQLEVLDVRGCNFKKLPEGMNKLINLRHLNANSDTISLISSIGKLTKLQGLEEYRVERSNGHMISELMNMNEISGHLLLNKLYNLSSKEEASKSQLGMKKYLKSLELRFQYNCGSSTNMKMEILDALKPACSLEILKVRGCSARYLPSWMFSPHLGLRNLKVIHVSDFLLSSLPAFGEHPSLEILTFHNLPLLKKVGSEFYGSSDSEVFPSLKELTFTEMQAWSDWSGAESGKTIFPHLKKLHLEGCPLLEKLPVNSFTSSKQGMPSLAYLSIAGSGSSESSFDIHYTLLNSLEDMRLTRFETICFVGGSKTLFNLRTLKIYRVKTIMQIYDEELPSDEISPKKIDEQCLPFLTCLDLRDCNFPRVGRMPSLRTLVIKFYPEIKFTRDEESLFNQLTSLENLEFGYCLELTHLPSTLYLLTSLKKLNISSCPKLCSLPENGLPKNLAELYIEKCSHLLRQCQPNQGDDWQKISHIPFLHLKE